MDQIKSGGKGTSNDGNIERHFNANTTLSVEINGLDASGIERCTVILQTI